MLHMTKIELKLISDADTYLFFEKAMTDGVSYISERHSKDNNKYLKSYDSKQESKHLCLDANNLYGYARSRFLPTNVFKWIQPKEFDSNKYSSDNSKNYVCEDQNVSILLVSNMYNGECQDILL